MMGVWSSPKDYVMYHDQETIIICHPRSFGFMYSFAWIANGASVVLSKFGKNLFIIDIIVMMGFDDGKTKKN